MKPPHFLCLSLPPSLCVCVRVCVSMFTCMSECSVAIWVYLCHNDIHSLIQKFSVAMWVYLCTNNKLYVFINPPQQQARIAAFATVALCASKLLTGPVVDTLGGKSSAQISLGVVVVCLLLLGLLAQVFPTMSAIFLYSVSYQCEYLSVYFVVGECNCHIIRITMDILNTIISVWVIHYQSVPVVALIIAVLQWFNAPMWPAQVTLGSY